MSKHWATTSDVLTNTEMRTWNGLRTSRCCETAAPPVVSGSQKWKLKFIEFNSDGREEVRTQQGLGDPKGRGGDDKYTVRRPQEPQQEKKKQH